MKSYRKAFETGHVKVEGDSNVLQADRPGDRAPGAAGPAEEGPLRRVARASTPSACRDCVPPPSSFIAPSRCGDPVEVARAIAGAQAQDVYAGPLTFRSRSRRLTRADIRAGPHRGALAAAHLGDADDDPSDPG